MARVNVYLVVSGLKCSSQHTLRKYVFFYIKVRDPHSQLATEMLDLLEFPLLKKKLTSNSVLSDFTILICVCVCMCVTDDNLEFRVRSFLNEHVVCHPN